MEGIKFNEKGGDHQERIDLSSVGECQNPTLLTDSGHRSS